MKTADVIIVGSGLAGTYIALHLPKNLNVLVLSNHKTNSSLAQGGIAMCLNKDDTFASHINDTLTAGWHENDIRAVRKLVQEAPQHLSYLNSFGVYFDQDDSDQLSSTFEGGHSNPRVIHINGDQTGKSMMATLHAKLASEANITLINNASLLDLCVHDHTVKGIVYEHHNHIHQLKSPIVVIATGGICDLYKHTTNRKGSTGDGLAIAARAGAQCRDLRYIQFHPTAFLPAHEEDYFLITEALRGVGAYLLDDQFKRFMVGIHPLQELAPRDIVSKAIYDVLKRRQLDYIFIDTRHLESEYLAQRFPKVYRVLEASGYIMGQDLIPVVPVAHYSIGGITTDLNGCTSIKNLYACGEIASTGVHGANRLASNSLLECLVFGKSIATHISTHFPIVNTKSLVMTPYILYKNPSCKDANDYKSYKIKIQEIMSNYVGILRTTEGLEYANALLLKVLEELLQHNDQSVASIKIQNMIFVAQLIINDSLLHCSKGCHQKEVSQKELRLC